MLSLVCATDPDLVQLLVQSVQADAILEQISEQQMLDKFLKAVLDNIVYLYEYYF